MACIATIETSKRFGLEIADSTRPKKHRHPSTKLYDQWHIKTCINIHCKARRFPLSIALILLHVLNLATHVNVKSWTSVQYSKATGILCIGDV